MEEKFVGWKPPNFEKWDHVIIDGNNVCFTLYKKNHAWALGGEYDQFSDTVEEFFTTPGFKKPIVVFDGTHYDPKKMETICQRINYMTEMREEQAGRSESDGILSDTIVPLLIHTTFINVLKKMSIEYYMADGEADREIAALANHHKCPVLGSDSDFFIFNLQYGFINFDRFCDEEKKHLSFYHLKYFKNQFVLKERDLCLLIPSFFGNDILKVEKKFRDYDLFVSQLSKYDSCDEYLSTATNRIDYKDYAAMKKFYWELELPEYYKAKDTLTSQYVPNDLPEWVYPCFKNGEFPPSLIDAYLHKACILPRVVEVIKFESAWTISRYIRQRLYHIMGVSSDVKINEIRRENGKAKLFEDATSVKKLKPPVSIKEDFFLNQSKENKEIQSDLVLAILKCHKLSHEDIQSEFFQLDDDIKLPIAATIYWYRSLDDPPLYRDLVKCLLLSFLTCQGNLRKPLSVDIAPNPQALHALAQWQCVYYDAMCLNYLAREPFPTTSPAQLYSGNVVMYYAFFSRAHGWLDRTSVCEDSEIWRLFNQLLYLVTGLDEKGRCGQHAIPIKSTDEDSSWTKV